MALVNEAIAFEPTYMDYYTNAMYFLQPRWYGDKTDCEDFLRAQTDKRQGVDADIFYARNVWLLDLGRLDSNIFEAHRLLSWGRTRSGFDALLQKYPDSLSVKSEYARLCAQIGDKERAKQLFQEIGNQMDVRVWFDNTEDFQSFRKWSLQ
jgi:hypothetical protein